MGTVHKISDWLQRRQAAEGTPMNVATNVPSSPITWQVEHKGEQKLIRARLWFEARAAAMKVFVCGPEDVVVTRASSGG